MEEEERRKYLRTDDTFSLNYSKILEDATSFKTSTTLDIGGGGIRVITSEKIPLGCKLALKIDIPGLSQPISCIGEVAWAEEGEEKDKYYAGIKFVEIEEDKRQQVIQYIFTQHYQIEKKEEIAIEVNNIRKLYGKLEALRGINLKIKRGEIFALLGPNGAGKTTLTRILSTLLTPTTGYAKILGYDLLKNKREIRKIIGYMPQNYVLYDDLTAWENLYFFGKSYRIPHKKLLERIEEALYFTELEKRADSLFRTFSGGMKQRLSLACTLLHQPKILFLDEPTAGVDLKLRKNLWDYFHKLSETGVTLFVTTHQMDEVEYCQRCVFLHRGKIIIDDAPDNIKKMGRTKIVFSIQDRQEEYQIENINFDLPKIMKSMGEERLRDLKEIIFEESSLETILREEIKKQGEED